MSPRPEGISRRVAAAARDRQLGPLPEQRSTGWHRMVFDNPPRPVRPGHPDPTTGPGVDPASSGRAEPPRRPELPTIAATAPGVGHRPTTHRLAEPARRQVGRVLDPRPNRGRHWAAAVIAAVGTAAVVGAVLLVTAQAGPSDPVPEPAVPTAVASTARPAPAPPTTAESAPVIPAVPTGASPIGSTPADQAPVASPAVVSTLTPGDPGFGWPSNAFGSVAPGR